MINESFQHPSESIPFPRKATMLTLEEVAERTQLSMRTIYRRVQDGTIPAVRFGRVWRCPVAKIDALCNGQDVSSPGGTRAA